ncbi:MAG: PqqD family peptide modification chaperone, partial [Desulfofustis sp.]|nr:PqqD family peptide modification chaperone [Desulfofustis sp.]
MSLYSTYWYRVADIKPQLRNHTRLYRHIYRGQTWYVLQDPSSNRQHRFNKTAYFIIGLMDGKRTVAEIWTAATEALEDEAPTQDEIIQLLAQLHSADVMQSDIPPDTDELFQRQEKHRGKWKQRLTNPFALRFPLVDPDRFLVRWMHLVKPFIGRIGFLIWLLIVGCALILAARNWPELTHNMADRILKPENLLILWLVYPVVKLLHELAHAFATRIWGGEVHEMGIMLLALTPIPYVEASASATFPDKRRRMAVAAAGMAIELLVASLALFLWLSIESGRVSTIAYNVMLIGGVSTLLFNGNPLLRFDGYYILADWIEIPNLAQRSTRYLGYLLQRYPFGIEEASSPVTVDGERPWFIIYGIA